LQNNWLCAANSSSAWHTGLFGAPGWSSMNSPLSGFDGGVRLKITGLSGGAPDCPVSRPRRTCCSREKHQGDVAIIHRTVRWCTGLSGESTVASANGRPRNLRGTRGCSNGQLGAPDSVRCAIWPEGATVGCARFGRKSCTGQATVVVRSTEGKDSLPCWPSTTPRCLGAIKENPRRMEE
jgi:hypothetical protein